MVSRHQDALARLRSLRRGEESDEPDSDLDSGWTPAAPEAGSPNRRDRGPVWQVGWRAAALLGLVVVLGALGWLVRSSGGIGTPVEPRVSMTTATPAAGRSAVSEPVPSAGPAAVSSAGHAGRASASGGVVVHVVGAVAAPGLVRLPAGSRVADAVAAAGGATADADLARLNLARPVTDGEQVTVLRPGDPAPVAAPPGPAEPAGQPQSSGAGPAAGGSSGLVNLNTASESELDALPGIGPVLAARIIEWRTANGRFTSVDELGEVSGIGDKLLSQLRDKVTV